jgi:hypothetical protein
MRIVVSSALFIALAVGLSSISFAQTRYSRDRSGDSTSYQSDGQYSEQSGDAAGDDGQYGDQSGDTANYDSGDGDSTDQDQSADGSSYSSDDDNSSYQDQSGDSTSYSNDDGNSNSYGTAAGDSGDQGADCYVNRRGRTVCR